MARVQPWRSLPLRQRAFATAVVLAIAVLGGGLVVAALHERAGSRDVAHGVRADGVVVDVHVHTERSTTYTADVAFRTATGARFTIAGTTVESRPGLGDHVPVSYDPADPSAAHEVTASHGYLVGLVASVVFLLLALFLATARMRRALFGRR